MFSRSFVACALAHLSGMARKKYLEALPALTQWLRNFLLVFIR
jgi:hypothetical protein